MEEPEVELCIVMLPWLAMGHLLPFFELSKLLAFKGVHIFFFSSPSNLLRLPPIPQTIVSLLTYIPCTLAPISDLSPSIDNTVDLQSEVERSILDQAYASLEHHLSSFISDPVYPKPNWIIYDFAAVNWAPALASRFNLNAAYFSLFSSAAIAFIGTQFNSPEDLTKPPSSIPFSTSVAFCPFEARKIYHMLPKKSEKDTQPSSTRLMIIRSCSEFEPKWLDLVTRMHSPRLMVVPSGFIPPSFSSSSDNETDSWRGICEWLNDREERSVVYAAFGSEVVLTNEQIGEIGAGLEQSELPFLWALRKGDPPSGLEERTAGRGLVCRGWVPQARVLGHCSVGGFLTHAGWNSSVEGMAAGTTMVVLPMMFEQGLNARHLVETGYAVEVERDDEDGWFSSHEIARKLRFAMAEEDGDELRKMAMKGKELFGSEELQEKYILQLVSRLKQNYDIVPL